MDNLIRVVLHNQTAGEEPAESVRDKLLARAAQCQILPSVGETIPAVADGLRDDKGQSSVLSWWEIDRCEREHFLLWNYSWHTLSLLDLQLFRDARQCLVSLVSV